VLKASEQVTAGVEGIDEAVAAAGDVVVGFGVLLRVGDEDRAVDVLDAEGREAPGDLAIGEGAGPVLLGERVVEDVDARVVEIGGEEVGLARGVSLGQALEDRAVDRGVVDLQDGVGRVDGRIPAGDAAVLAGEDELRRA